ncbi:TPA: site-specific DNA-methyltransferase [Vibrio alginolyticus]
MDKLKMHSPDMTQQNIEKIQALFPNCVTESKGADGEIKLAIDFDQLKQELSSSVVEGPQERYMLNWPGKREALLISNSPIIKTLRPIESESINFWSAKDIFIEGDNLDGLKLIQESYLGKVKLIYIDPPYNTGGDFIYRDDYSITKSAFSELSSQVDIEGNKLTANLESNGRFHSDWLSMMYPRLKLARNLLRDDGQIFISISDEEVHNLRKMCDEIFGAENFEGHIHWRRRHNQPNDKTKMIGLVAEHILAYSKDKIYNRSVGVGKLELTGNFTNPDNDPRGPWASKPWKVGSDQSGSKYTIQTPTGKMLDAEWMGEKSTFESLLKDDRIYFPNNGDGFPRKKYYKSEREAEGQCATNWWSHEQFGHNQEGNAILSELMDGIKNTFSNPKPTRLINSIINVSNCKDGDVVLDFFLGSGTTYQAAIESGLDIRFIGIQIDDPLDEKNKDHLPALDFCKKNGLKKVLSELTKERMRRVLTNVANSDLNGFRVFKIDESNMSDVYYSPDDLSQGNLDLLVDNIKPDRTDEDLLFQVLLDWGIELSMPIRKETIQGKSVFFVDDDALVACFDLRINEALIKELAKKEPLRVVFRDDGFESDAVKINAEQIFKQVSPHTEVKAI